MPTFSGNAPTTNPIKKGLLFKEDATSIEADMRHASATDKVPKGGSVLIPEKFHHCPTLEKTFASEKLSLGRSE
jgi:hypothetical protein